MESASNENETPATHSSEAPKVPTPSAVEPDNAAGIEPSKLSTSGLSTWAKSLKIPDLGGKQDSTTSDKSPFARFTSGLGLRLSPKAPQTNDNSEGTSPSAQSNFIGTLTKGLVDSSKSAVKAVQVKARHVVSQNKRRYQEGGFDLDMTYITENIIAMGFPAGDMSSGFFGYVEGFYRNHMEEVIKFFETNHKDKYKVYNLCSERLYDASLFEGKSIINRGAKKGAKKGANRSGTLGYPIGVTRVPKESKRSFQFLGRTQIPLLKVASFPFDDHNCPPIQLIISFCKSAYSWLKEDIENVVVVHCKAGMARTGLMISSLLLYLKFFPTAEESIDYYNQKRCFDSKGLVLPSQIRYVKYFERILTYFSGENQPGRRCMLRGFRLHRCPYWIRPSITISNHNGVLFSTKKHPRTKDLSPEDYWFSAPKKGVMVFALPGEPGLTELAGDFKIHFHDGQGDFYCWLNTTMIENRKVLTTNELDGFDKRKLPSPGFQLEVVLVDYNGSAPNVPVGTPTETSANGLVGRPGTDHASTDGAVGATAAPQLAKESGSSEKDDDVFSDNEAEEDNSSKPRQARVASEAATTDININPGSHGHTKSDQVSSLSNDTEKLSLGKTDTSESKKAADGAVSGLGTSNPVGEVSEFKAMAADASVFTFGDEDDYGSD